MARSRAYAPGTKVSIKEGFFKGTVGEVDKKQDEVAGLFVNISAVPNGAPRRLWFPESEVEKVS